jgi:RNA recognition motif-containing protein
MLFVKAGPVIGFRFMYDKEERRKGYGCCEFLKKEDALTALRDFDGVEFAGRKLSVRQVGTRLDSDDEENVSEPPLEKRARETEKKNDDDAPEPPKKKPRVVDVLTQVQELTFGELASVSPAVRAQLLALCEVLKLDQ